MVLGHETGQGNDDGGQGKVREAARLGWTDRDDGTRHWSAESGQPDSGRDFSLYSVRWRLFSLSIDLERQTFENLRFFRTAFAFHIVFSMLLGAGGTVLILDGYNPDVAAHYFHNYSPLAMPDPPKHLVGATHICVPDAVHGDMLSRAHLYGKLPSKPGEVVPWEERAYCRWRFALSSNFANTAKQMIRMQQEYCPHAYMIQGYGSSEVNCVVSSCCLPI